MASLLHTLQVVGLFVLVLPSGATSPENMNDIRRRQVSQDICASVNTASGSATVDRWQTNGLCRDMCIEQDYAFAITQFQSCWCSNVAPAQADRHEVSSCNEICPGYDLENCGRRPSRYGYVRLVRSPTSTQGQSNSSPTESSSRGSGNTSPTAVETVTADGTVRTVFITPSGSSSDLGSGETDPATDGGGGGGGSSLKPGEVAGIVVGVLGGIAAIALVAFLILARRRKQQRQDQEKYDEPSQRGSSAGVVGGTPRHPDMASTVDGRGWEGDSGSEQRRSRLMAVDPRMDPFQRGMYARNKSHESVNTIRDDQDYSRRVAKPVLRATNPDPTDD